MLSGAAESENVILGMMFLCLAISANEYAPL
jgi:hypothetical protein